MSHTSRPHEPLDREEQALAALLAGDTPGEGPSPALDAAILATARAAAVGPVTAPARSARRPRLAWAAGAGLAASLVLAVGVAWQVRPQGEAFEVQGEAPASMAVPGVGDARRTPVAEARAVMDARAEGATHDAATRDAVRRADAEPQRTDPQAAASASASPVPPPDDVALEIAVPAPPPPPASPPVVFDEPQPMDAPATPPRASGQPTAIERTGALSRVLAEDEAADAARQRAVRTRPAASAPAPAAAPAKMAAPVPAAAPPFDESSYDQPLDDTPPASLDAPDVRDAWLARIRELVAEERYTEARESFGEFRRRYPDIAVPRDLRVLLP